MALLAALIPGAEPTPIPGMEGPVAELFGYGLWFVLLAGAAACGWGAYKLATVDKGRSGNGAEPAKWMAGGVGAIILSGSLIAILNGIAG
ncbi:hypothetical protein ACWDV7_20420 [Streptomyces sp. NPDC003362]|uniref:hypothetical protein n=1 Tax=Streptomyces sp. enrichment culture TaxID=1795815 RepID=UPI003F5483ED